MTRQALSTASLKSMGQVKECCRCWIVGMNSSWISTNAGSIIFNIKRALIYPYKSTKLLSPHVFSPPPFKSDCCCYFCNHCCIIIYAMLSSELAIATWNSRISNNPLAAFESLLVCWPGCGFTVRFSNCNRIYEFDYSHFLTKWLESTMQNCYICGVKPEE